MPRKRGSLRADVVFESIAAIKSSKLLQSLVFLIIGALCIIRAGKYTFTVPFLVVSLVFHSDIYFELRLCKWYLQSWLGYGKTVTVVSPYLVLGDILLSKNQVYNIRKKHHLSVVVSLINASTRKVTTMFGKFVNLQEPDNKEVGGQQSNDEPIQHTIIEVQSIDSLTERELKLALNTINRFTQEGKNIYLHGLTGNGVDACVALVYLIQFERLGIDVAYDKLQGLRPTIFSKQSKYYKMIENFQKSVS